MTTRGRLLVFEGVDGCGKTTQVRRVASALDAVCTFEPGDTPAGAALRAVVLDPAVTLDAMAELLVMAADRAQHVAEVIEPALAAGRDVVCDRFSGSTLAYQGYGRGLDLETVQRVTTTAANGLEPDLTVLLDCPPSVARSRLDGAADRFEAADASFADRVRDGFRSIAAASPGWRVVDGSQPLAAVSAAVDAAVAEVLG